MNASIKISQSKESKGFTLVEMLVVIGMIAALAGVSFPVYRSIQKKVEGRAVSMELTSLDRAVDNFVTEYTYMPYIGSSYPTADAQYNSAQIREWMGVLVGAESVVNFKRIKFFEPREVKGGPGSYHSGLLTNNDGSVIYYTPWGTELLVMRVDHNMDNIINRFYAMGDGTVPQGYIYVEQGPDGLWYDFGSPAGTVKDDLENFRDSAYQ
jgi:prepilin-type N-terminal cleavage/methylation domain-containing protein